MLRKSQSLISDRTERKLRTIKTIRSIQILFISIGLWMMIWSVDTGSVIGLMLFGVGILGLIFQVILKQIRSVKLKKQQEETYKGIENYRTAMSEMWNPYQRFNYMYPQTRKRRRKRYKDQQIEKYAAWANIVSNMKDEPDRSEYKLTYEDMYGDSKSKTNTNDSQYSDREYFAEAVERVKKYNREHPQNNQNKVDIQTITVKYGNGKTVQSGLYSVSTKKEQVDRQ